MRKKKYIFLITLFFCITVYSDKLVLTNGDILSGDILNISTEAVSIETIYDEKIIIPFNLISELESKNSIILINNLNQNIVVNNLKKMDNIIYFNTDEEFGKIEKSKINSLNLETSTKKEKNLVKSSGNIGINYFQNSGNTNTKKFIGNFYNETSIDKNRLIINFKNNESSDNNLKTASNWDLNLKYDYIFSDTWYSFLNNSFEKDTFRDIDLRESYGIGLGNRKKEFLNFKTTYELGFSNVKTKHNLTSNKNFNAAIWLLNLEKSFSIFNLKFFHKNNGIQEINGNNQLIVKSNTGLKLPILKNIYLSYELQVDWEKKPSSNKKKTDKINYFTLGYEW